MYCAGTALCYTATKFGSHQIQVVTKYPQKWGIRFDLNFDCFVIDIQGVCFHLSTLFYVFEVSAKVISDHHVPHKVFVSGNIRPESLVYRRLERERKIFFGKNGGSRKIGSPTAVGKQQIHHRNKMQPDIAAYLDIGNTIV